MRKTAHLWLVGIILFSLMPILISCPALGTIVDADITADTTWTEAGSPYIITTTIHVAQGSTLTVQEGTTVKFDGFYSLIVEGTMVVTGTQTNMVTFTTNLSSPAPGDWSNIKFTITSSASLVSHAVIEYGRTGIYAEQSSPTILNNTITNIENKAIDAYESYSDIRGNTISQADIGIKGQYGSPTISDNTISNTVNAIDLKGINSRIEGNELEQNGVGIILNSSSPMIVGNDISFNGEGIIAQDGSNPTVEENTISFNSKSGIWCVSSTDTVVYMNTISSNSIGIESDGSVLTVSRNTLSVNDISIQAEDDSELDVMESSISNSFLFSFVLETNSYVTTVNSTFELNKVSVDDTSTLVVRNYLIGYVKTLDNQPLEDARVEISDRDDNDVVYAMYTDSNGLTQQKLVTDRIYHGSSVATENPTHVNVSYENLTFVNNPRDVDMSWSHTETFIEAMVEDTPEDSGEPWGVIAIATILVLVTIVLVLALIARRKTDEKDRHNKSRKRSKKKSRGK